MGVNENEAEEGDFETAREIAQAILDATIDIDRETKLLGVAIYVAAQAAARGETVQEAHELAERFYVMMMVQLEDMLDQDRRKRLS